MITSRRREILTRLHRLARSGRSGRSVAVGVVAGIAVTAALVALAPTLRTIDAPRPGQPEGPVGEDPPEDHDTSNEDEDGASTGTNSTDEVDPNGLRDGIGGMARPSGDEFRIPKGFPHGGNTGLAASELDYADLEKVGSLTITEDGAVVEGVHARSVQVHADDVTIRDSVIEGPSLYSLDAYRYGQQGLLVERVDVHQADPCRKAIYAANAELRQVNAWGGDTVAVLRSNVTVLDSFIHDTAQSRNPNCPDRHYDGVHTQGAESLHIARSTLLGPWQGQTSALIAQSNQSPLHDLRVQDSFLSGGTYSLYVRDRGQGPPRDVRAIGNVWQADSWHHGPTSLDRTDGWIWSANVTTDGELIE